MKKRIKTLFALSFLGLIIFAIIRFFKSSLVRLLIFGGLVIFISSKLIKFFKAANFSPYFLIFSFPFWVYLGIIGIFLLLFLIFLFKGIINGFLKEEK